MLLWGPPPKFASGQWDPEQEKSEVQLIDDGRTADHLLNWINKQIGRQVVVHHFFFNVSMNRNQHMLAFAVF